MPSPFPGMDPYLERPSLWPDVHHEMIRGIRAALNPLVLPAYTVRVQERVYVSPEDELELENFLPHLVLKKSNGSQKMKATGTIDIDPPVIIPYVYNATIEEPYLEIKDRKTNRLITVIEVLSPANKIRGSRRRASYMEKREKLLESNAHLVEIDLLRCGDLPIKPLLDSGDHRVFLSRGDDRKHTRCWPIRLRDRLPVIGIPLKKPDADVPLDMNSLLKVVYASGAYENAVDYTKPCKPPLKPANARWASRLLKEAGLR